MVSYGTRTQPQKLFHVHQTNHSSIHPSIHSSWFTPVHNNSTNFDFRCNVTARDFKAANSYHSICWKAMNLLVMRASAVNPFHTTKDVHGNYVVLWLGFATLSYKLWYVTNVQANECFVCNAFSNGLGWTFSLYLELHVLSRPCKLDDIC
jgi:hypothetical protein